MTDQSLLQKTPLYDDHLRLDARMVEFGGWNMPVQYSGILDEHKHTREAVSLFDICHMGEFVIQGSLDETGLDHIVTMNLRDLPVKACRYGMILNPQGGIIDDLIVFRLEEEKWFIVVNAARIDIDAAHFKANLSDASCFRDISRQTGKIDIQGPLARDILKNFVLDLEKLKFYNFDIFNLLGEDVVISRTGYTGELGYEIYYPADKISKLWNTLLENPQVKAAGLGARDMLRLEVGYSLYGHELTETITPIEAGLERFVDYQKDFIGKDALLKKKNEEGFPAITGIISDSRKSPREGQAIFNPEGQTIGRITSGTFSPKVGCGIGLGYISPKLPQGTEIFFGNEKSKSPGRVSGRIFYKEGSLKT